MPAARTNNAYVAALEVTPRCCCARSACGCPVYPAKGYSATVPLGEDSVAPSVSLTDDGHKIVFSRLGQRLRVAGTAEFNGYNTELNAVRCGALMRRADELFPNLRAAGAAKILCGLRPATPSSVPLIGRSPIANHCTSIPATAPLAGRWPAAPAPRWPTSSAAVCPSRTSGFSEPTPTNEDTRPRANGDPRHQQPGPRTSAAGAGEALRALPG